MIKRPYSKLRIEQLEQLFDRDGSDANVRAALLHELKHHRKTRRADRLRERIESVHASGSIKPSPGIKTTSPADHQAADPIPPDPVPLKPERTKPYTSSSKADQSAVPPRPAITNKTEHILSAWMALEVLSPQVYRREADLAAGQRNRIAYLNSSPLPWERDERSRPQKKLFYELILGSISMAPAVEKLLKVYADSNPNPPGKSGYCPLASVILDKKGCPVPDAAGATIASFAWGLPVALRGDLRPLGDWPAKEKELLNWFRSKLIQHDDDGEPVPLTQSRINALFQALVAKLELNGHDIQPPSFAIRQYVWFRSKSSPETILLNSFFLEDLAAARHLAAKGELPQALRHYLQEARPPQRVDLLNDASGLRRLLQPALTPPGRWPARGRFALSLLQQAAVNATNPSLMSTGILGVNGPPGTGKTTLLRDVVAARVVERAIAMSGYDRPAEAFKPTRQSVQRDGATIRLHRLDDQLKGFEMVVASSNNKAVENVSAELPGLDAIAEDAVQLRYFKSVSDHIFGCETWGTIAAVLGKASNRFDFAQRFWKDEEHGLSTYLNHASGVRQTVIEQTDEGQPHERLREVIRQEQPPASPQEALARWKQVRTRFGEARRAAELALEKRQLVHQQLEQLHTSMTELEVTHAALPKLETELLRLQSQHQTAQQVCEIAAQQLARRYRDNEVLRGNRPGYWHRFFRTTRMRQWSQNLKESNSHISIARGKEFAAKQELDKIFVLIEATRDRITTRQQSIAKLEGTYKRLRDSLKRYREDSSVQIPDDAFFASPHASKQIANVWFDQNDAKVRDELFVAAIDLHRAFVDAAAVPLRQNLAVFFPFCGTQPLGNVEKDALLPELWASLFLVVPVISTTFASVRRMFANLPPESLGWLLVDEAGQAVPQAAVGAIMRARRAVVVGDPLQIEPVVTLPASLTEQICGQFGIDEAAFNAPRASVQTLADAASRYQGTFQVGAGEREVGAPLLVHRRCDSPMFEISNAIAYGNLMVQAKRPSSKLCILGASRWMDVVGIPGPDKWCEDEARELITHLTTLRNAGQDADVYIVTPFVVVQHGLREAIQRSGLLDGWVDQPHQWAIEHVGTVHTVQGREADAVFFVLGAQSPSQAGARAWAGARPNLVNVAVTRAQRSLYVIGNRQIWRSEGVFAELDQFLPSSI